MVGEYSKEDGKKLLKLARQTIAREFDDKVSIEKLEGKQFMQARGVFVTLTLNDELKGCIGLPYPTKKITDAIQEAAKSSAFSDPRFLPLQKSELDKVKIEVSILTLPQESSVKEIEVGKDGLICSYLGYSGLLLPQVASEYKWSKIEFLENLCGKAGLPKNAWQDKKFKLWKFQAEIFKEQ